MTDTESSQPPFPPHEPECPSPSGDSSTIGWRFPPLDTGSFEGHTKFDEAANQGALILDNLARETIQNSLDAARSFEDPSFKGPVEVVYELTELSASLPFLRAYREAFEQAEAYQAEQRDEESGDDHAFFSEAGAMLDGFSIPCLKVSDYGTTGAMGASFTALAHSRGLSRQKRSGGGSFGIGKAAAEACSTLSLVLYATKGLNGAQLFEGATHLATFRDRDGVLRSAEGHYIRAERDGENMRALPLTPEDGDELERQFRRDKVGTDVIIVGFKPERDFVQRLTEAVIRNCLVAIHDGRLVVRIIGGVERQVIDSMTLPGLLQTNPDKSLQLSREWYGCFEHPDVDERLELLEPGDARVRVVFDPDDSNWTGIFKRNGMLLYRQGYGKDAPHAALVELTGTTVSNLLLQSEDPSHRRWDMARIADLADRRQARHVIGQIREAVRTIVFDHASQEMGEEMDSGETVFSDEPAALATGVRDLLVEFGSSLRDIFLPNLQTRPARRARTGQSKARGDAVPGSSGMDASNDEAGETSTASTDRSTPDRTSAQLPESVPDATPGGGGDESGDVFEPGEGRPHRILASSLHIRPDIRRDRTWIVLIQPDRDYAEVTFRLRLATADGRGVPVAIYGCESEQVPCRVEGDAVILEGLKRDSTVELGLWLDVEWPGAFIMDMRGA